MAVPLDVIMAFHNAFRRDMAAIDAAALAIARADTANFEPLARLQVLNDVLAVHARGEELVIFPMLENVAPSVAQAYIADHRGLDSAYERVGRAVSAGDALETARATAALKFHLNMHLAKEDSHLYRLFAERISMADQAEAIRSLSSTVPREMFPAAIRWIFPLLGSRDRENLTRVWQMLMPPDAFAGVKQLIQQALGEEWNDLTVQIPELST